MGNAANAKHQRRSYTLRWGVQRIEVSLLLQASVLNIDSRLREERKTPNHQKKKKKKPRGKG